MKRTTGRNVFVTDLARVIGRKDPGDYARASSEARLKGVWIRVGRGPNRDPNMTYPKLAALRTELSALGIELWGWHVPFCADRQAASAEAKDVLSWSDDGHLDGILVDAERTPENPRFRGNEQDAEIYLRELTRGLDASGRGVAFSSHDQPSLHRDMPFQPFLHFIEDVCPQVYYTSAKPETRLRKSIRDYRALIPTADFASRYKPTGNITMKDDVKFPDLDTCLTATSSFLDLVKNNGFSSCSFWCWDTAPDEVWQRLRDTPALDSPLNFIADTGVDMNLDAAQLRLNLVQDYVPVGVNRRSNLALTHF